VRGAHEGNGFVIGFDSSHAGFQQLTGRGRLGKVCYSDEPIGSALGSLWNGEAIGAFFPKRMKYAFEQEWRIIRMLHRLERGAENVFLSPSGIPRRRWRDNLRTDRLCC